MPVTVLWFRDHGLEEFQWWFFSCWEEEQAEKSRLQASQRGRAGPAWGTGSSKMLHAIPCPRWIFGFTWEQNYDGKPNKKEWAGLHCLFILSWGA